MPCCSAFGCNNSSINSEKLSFFRFPLDNPSILKQWIHNSERADWKPSKFHRLCSAHFVETCFEVDIYHQLMGQDPSKRRRRRTLIAGSIPTIFNHPPAQTHNKRSSRLLSIKSAAKSQHDKIPAAVPMLVDLPNDPRRVSSSRPSPRQRYSLPVPKRKRSTPNHYSKVVLANPDGNTSCKEDLAHTLTEEIPCIKSEPEFNDENSPLVLSMQQTDTSIKSESLSDDDMPRDGLVNESSLLTAVKLECMDSQYPCYRANVDKDTSDVRVAGDSGVMILELQNIKTEYNGEDENVHGNCVIKEEIDEPTGSQLGCTDSVYDVMADGIKTECIEDGYVNEDHDRYVNEDGYIPEDVGIKEEISSGDEEITSIVSTTPGENKILEETYNLVKTSASKHRNFDGHAMSADLKSEPVNDMDTGDKPHSCPECCETFTYSHDLTQHMFVHIKNVQKSNPSGSMIFSLPDHVKQHMLNWSTAPCTCEVCGKNVPNPRCLAKHMYLHRGVSQYSCPECNKICSQSSALEAHMRTHTGEKPYMCPTCNKHYAHSSSLKIHMLTHTGQKPQVCPKCEMCFVRVRELNKHVLTHGEEVSYSCPDCQKVFAKSQGLKLHMRIHTEQRSLLCTECDRTFTQPSRLHRHMSTHTK